MICPNCETPNPNLSDTSPHCVGCGANLRAKKYIKAEDPGQVRKDLEDANKKIEDLAADNARIKSELQRREDEDAERNKRTKRTLFGN